MNRLGRNREAYVPAAANMRLGTNQVGYVPVVTNRGLERHFEAGKSGGMILARSYTAGQAKQLYDSLEPVEKKQFSNAGLLNTFLEKGGKLYVEKYGSKYYYSMEEPREYLGFADEDLEVLTKNERDFMQMLMDLAREHFGINLKVVRMIDKNVVDEDINEGQKCFALYEFGLRLDNMPDKRQATRMAFNASYPEPRAMCGYCHAILAQTQWKACTGCRSVVYCSKECQVQDWSRHKISCDRIDKQRNK